VCLISYGNRTVLISCIGIYFKKKIDCLPIT